jgi:hypothetical protein
MSCLFAFYKSIKILKIGIMGKTLTTTDYTDSKSMKESSTGVLKKVLLLYGGVKLSSSPSIKRLNKY